jgi:hypothetical protein
MGQPAPAGSRHELWAGPPFDSLDLLDGRLQTLLVNVAEHQLCSMFGEFDGASATEARPGSRDEADATLEPGSVGEAHFCTDGWHGYIERL